jgi:thiamine-phosphate pyrophosphorylase
MTDTTTGPKAGSAPEGAAEAPRLYLVTPSDDAGLLERVLPVLDSREVACLRLQLATRDEERLMRAADAMREAAHARDIPVVIAEHQALVERLGLDGVHLSDGRGLGKLRRGWGEDPIIGAHCGASRHDGLLAGEAGADYVSFGPAGASALGDGTRAERALFVWWSEMIEVPVVAEGALDTAAVETLAPVADFFAVGAEIWETDDPARALGTLLAPLG